MAQTKFHPPRWREDVVARQPLLAALEAAALAYPLTLVSAPAGYGKTTLLAALSYLAKDHSPRLGLHGDGRPRQALPLAWLSLDEEDNDPARFLAALAAALQHMNPACGTTTRAALMGLPNPAAEARRVIGVLVNDLLENQPDPFVLALDDLHLVTEPAVYAALDYLIDRLPPQAHLTIAARHDPPLALARLRARGQVAELRLPDLRFSLEETGRFLNEKLGLGLSPGDLAALHARAEGWVAGLRLLAGSLGRMASAADRSAFVHHLAHTDRYVFAFLAEEVLKRQEPEVRDFLLETSILSELTPALCQAATGRADARAVLEELYRRNLFLVEVEAPVRRGDEEGARFRYHALFAEFLQGRLAQEAPERLAELHLRAARAERLADRALRHYLAAEAWEEAARTVERVGGHLVRQGLLDTLSGWIAALPLAVREARPRLIFLLGVCAAQRGDLDAAQPLQERALRGFEAGGDEAGQGEALMELASVAGGHHDYRRVRVLTDQALALPIPPRVRVFASIGRAWQGLYGGDATQTAADVGSAIGFALESGEMDAFTILGLQLRAPFTFLPGCAEPLERYCRQVLARLGDEIGLAQAGARCLLGSLHLLRGRLDDAVREVERARSMSARLGGFLYIDLDLDIAQTALAMARGEVAAVERQVDARLPWFEQTPGARPWLIPVLFFKGRAQWLQGRLEAARETHARMAAGVTPQDLPEARVTLAMMSALLEVADKRYVSAERTLRRAVALQQEMRHTLLFGSARLLLAYLSLRWNRPRDALSELGPVLAECDMQGMPGLVLQEGPVLVPLLRLAIEREVSAAFAARLLDSLGSAGRTGPVAVLETGESLTPREMEVLALLASGASNRAIAEQLVITERTAKAHVTSILGKLRVASRAQAVARARELRLA